MSGATGPAAELLGDPGEPAVQVLPDAEAAASEAAIRIADALARAAHDRGRADWITTGGSSPVPIYRRLGQPPLRDRVPWPQVHVWWTDDRMVPRDHPLSNRLPFDQVLLRAAGLANLSGSGEDSVAGRPGDWPGVPIPEANIHGIPIDFALGRTTSVDAAAAEAASTYESALRAAPLGRDGQGFPIVDAALLGVGPDGHVLSVFPGSPLFDSKRWVQPVAAPSHVEPHVERVSLHPGFVGAARLVVVVVTGAGKAEVVRDVLTGDRDVRRWPAQLARRAGAVWLLDEAAAAELPARVARR